MHVNTFQVGDLLGFQSFSCVCYLKKKDQNNPYAKEAHFGVSQVHFSI